MGAPIRRALQGLATGNTTLPPFNHLLGEGKTSDSCEINYRKDEKYWVVAAKGEVTVSFALQFENTTDRALARIFLLVSLYLNC